MTMNLFMAPTSPEQGARGPGISRVASKSGIQEAMHKAGTNSTPTLFLSSLARLTVFGRTVQVVELV
jgi:hypothetical protein